MNNLSVFSLCNYINSNIISHARNITCLLCETSPAFSSIKYIERILIYCYIKAQCMIHHRKHHQFRCIYKKIQYLTFAVKATRNFAQYPLHHVTYTTAKFEVATSNSLVGDTFTRKYIIWPLTLSLVSMPYETLPSTLYIMWPMTLTSGPRSLETLSSTLYINAKLELLCPTV